MNFFKDTLNRATELLKKQNSEPGPEGYTLFVTPQIGTALAIAKRLYGSKNKFHKDVADKTKILEKKAKKHAIPRN